MLIGLVGATGSGKTTLADMLVERHSFERVHMGQPIKDMLRALGLSEEELTGPPEVRARPSPLLDGRSPRYAMETLGTDWGRRMISPNIWANAVDLWIGELRDGCARRIVIDDLRFPSDWRVVERAGGVLVRITRPGVSRRRTVLDRLANRIPSARRILLRVGASPIHETEYHWHDAPARIELSNAGKPEALLAQLSRALELRA